MMHEKLHPDNAVIFLHDTSMIPHRNRRLNGALFNGSSLERSELLTDLENHRELLEDAKYAGYHFTSRGWKRSSEIGCCTDCPVLSGSAGVLAIELARKTSSDPYKIPTCDYYNLDDQNRVKTPECQEARDVTETIFGDVRMHFNLKSPKSKEKDIRFILEDSEKKMRTVNERIAELEKQ